VGRLDTPDQDLMQQSDFVEVTCGQCAEGAGLDFDFSFAFQPIVDVDTGEAYSYEALVRGINGEPAGEVLGRIRDDNRYRFDQACRVKAIALASRLGLACNLNINFLPRAVYQPQRCIRTTLEAARAYDFPIERIVFEVTEGERVDDTGHLVDIIHEYHRLGFRTAIDDFGAGYSGLNLLAEYQSDYLKLDMKLTRGIDSDGPRQAIVRGVVYVCRELGIRVVAEGVETASEYRWLREAGVRLQQGYYFARPGFEALPSIDPAALAS